MPTSIEPRLAADPPWIAAAGRECLARAGVARVVVVPRVALLPGSTRSTSLNRQLAAALVGPLEAHDVEAHVIDLAEFPMPIYHGDDEARHGHPEAAVALHDLLTGFDGLILVTPEYNGGPSALLKNSIDWVTRVDRGVFRRFVVGLAAASPGSRGARTGLAVMRTIIEHMRLDIVPDDLSIPDAGAAFELVGGVPTLRRTEDVEAASAFVAGYATWLRERLAQSVG